MAITQLWVEKFRPADIEGYVFRDETQRVNKLSNGLRKVQYLTYYSVVRQALARQH